GHLASTTRVQLPEQVVDVRLRCRQADVQAPGDLFVTEPGSDQFGSLAFAFGERRHWEWRIAAVAGASAEGDPAEQPGGDTAGTDLLATMDLKNQAREIRQSGGARDIADHARLRPGNDVLFGLSDRERDDAHTRLYIESTPDCGGAVRHRGIQQQD